MGLQNLTFISMADEKFIGPLMISVSQAIRFHPESEYFIYDVGLSEKSRKDLLSISKDVHIIPWTLRYLPVELAYSRSFVGMKGIGLLQDFIASLFGDKSFSRLRSLIKQSHLEIFFQNKLSIIKYHNDTVQRPFIFLDADAFLIKNIDELFNDSFDLAVTLRRKEERSNEFNNCRLLNVGVMFFLGNYETNKALINQWYKNARQTNELYSEQTSLTRLLLRLDPEIFQQMDTVRELKLDDGHLLKVKVLDCNIYNFSWIEELKNEDDLHAIKIVHFKNERFNTEEFRKIGTLLKI
jgi:hypothetical protein